jgi:putative heme-binding domain-containing protein
MWLGVSALPVRAADPPSAAGSVLKLLKSGKVPPARLPSVVEMVCSRGNEHDLAYVFEQTLNENAYALELRQQALLWLKEAALNRKTLPANREALGSLLDPAAVNDEKLQLRAIELAHAWKAAGTAPLLVQIARSDKSTDAIRAAAMSALVAVDSVAAKEIANELLAEGQSYHHRTVGVETLAGIDLASSAQAAAQVLQSTTAEDDPGPIVDAMLAREGGAEQLGLALKATPLSQDVAKLCLRRVYSEGRSDPGLLDVLAPQAGVSAKPVKLTPEQVTALAIAAAEKGNAARGEQVFRRGDLSCMKCHALNKAGGQIGPDLTPVGANSPMEYLVTALFDPDAQIKEAFITRTVTTLEGRIFQGITVDRTDQKLVLRNTESQLIEIPISEIDEEIEGKSLMPKGLPTLLTENETHDLLKFLSELGRPGPYAVRSTQRFQRWKVLVNAKPELLTEIPNLVVFETDVLANGLWGSAYALVNGNLPLDEIAARQKSKVFYLQGEIEVVEAGPATLNFDSPGGLHVWLGKETVNTPAGATVDLQAGRQTLTIRVDTTARPESVLSLELTRPEGTHAQFQVVDGQ